MCISLRGALMNWHDRKWRNCVKDDEGNTLSPQDVKSYFLEKLAEGKKVIPLDPICNNLDFQTGCRGHEEGEA